MQFLLLRVSIVNILRLHFSKSIAGPAFIYLHSPKHTVIGIFDKIKTIKTEQQSQLEQ